MKIKKIITCIISCILFTVCIPFTAVADNDAYSNDFDKYRKYINPNWDFEVSDVPEDIPYTLEQFSEIWDDVKYYDLTFNDLYENMTNKEWYDPDALWVYFEEPVYFLYGHDSDTSIEFQGSSKHRYSGVECIPYVPDTYKILNFWYSNEPDGEWATKENNFITSYTQWLDSVGATCVTNNMYDGSDQCYTAYRVGTMCVLYADCYYVSDFVSNCSASESEIIEKFDHYKKELYEDSDYNIYNGYESYDGYECCEQALCLSYNCFTDAELDKLFWCDTYYSCCFYGSSADMLMLSNKLDTDVTLFGINIKLYKPLMENKYYGTIYPTEYTSDQPVYMDTFYVEQAKEANDGTVSIEKHAYYVYVYWDGSIHIGRGSYSDHNVSMFTIRTTRSKYDTYFISSDNKNSYGTLYMHRNRTYSNDKEYQAITLRCDSETGRLCKINGTDISYLSDSEVDYTFTIEHNQKVDASYHVHLYHPTQARTHVEKVEVPETEDKQVVYDETIRLMNRIKELEAENEKLKSGNNNSYTGYITIEQNNGTAAERFPVTVYSDGKTETTEEFQNYINSLNVKIEQLMSRINLVSNGSCGDIDGDGNISVEDAQLLLQYYTESKVAQLTDDPIDVWYSIKYGG